jgi:hypothetical protein
MAAKNRPFLIAKIAADDADGVYACKKTCREAEMRSRAAKHTIPFAKWSFKGIKSNRANNRKRHLKTSSPNKLNFE